MTLSCSAARCCAMAAPIPRLDPVTIAVFPFTRFAIATPVRTLERRTREALHGVLGENYWRVCRKDGARKRTRTSTPLRELGPEPSASASSAIRAQNQFYLDSVAFRNETPPTTSPVTRLSRNFLLDSFRHGLV